MSATSLRLPNLIIGGVHKAGTTALYTYLSKHPEICPSFKKEIDYFLPLTFDREAGPIEEYAGHFRHCGNQRFLLEASPSYLYGKERIAEKIKAACEQPRIIMILRDPAERLVSFFSRAVASSVLPKDLSFDEYVRISIETQDRHDRDIYARGVREGRYIEYLPPWLKVFGHDLKIVFFDDLRRDPHALMRNVCQWLSLDAACYEAQEFTIENKTVHYRFRRLHGFIHRCYMSTERFWRRNHGLKVALRRLYNAFNADVRRDSVVDPSAVERLRAIYAPSNRNLRLFLVEQGYSVLPSWLSDSS